MLVLWQSSHPMVRVIVRCSRRCPLFFPLLITSTPELIASPLGVQLVRHPHPSQYVVQWQSAALYGQ